MNKRAFSVLEYVVLIVIIITASLVMKTYIQRGMFGNWEKSGQSFAFGRQYDSQKTIECDFDEVSKIWYDRNCVQAQCPNGDPSCRESAITGGECSSSSCVQLNS